MKNGLYLSLSLSEGADPEGWVILYHVIFEEPAASAVDDDEFTEKEEEQKPNTSGQLGRKESSPVPTLTQIGFNVL